MRLKRSGRGVFGCCMWYRMSVILGSFSFFLSGLRAAIVGVVVKARRAGTQNCEGTRDMDIVVVEAGARVRERRD
jgi:hypothetical protein